MTIFAAKSLIIFLFFLVNFFVLFFVKTRSSCVIGLILSHLTAVLFFAVSISSYANFKSVFLILMIYSMMVLHLASYKIEIREDARSLYSPNLFLLFLNRILAVILIAIIFILILFVIINASEIADFVRENASLFIEKTQQKSAIIQNKIIFIKDEFQTSFLTKYSSSAILLICCVNIYFFANKKSESL